MFTCEYCNKSFRKENTLIVHSCEPKRRHLQKQEKHVQMGFRSYQVFYKVGTNTKKEKTYEDFCSSQYYNAFVKFGRYCLDLKIDDVKSFTEWLLKNNISLDRWPSDKNFHQWIKQRLKSETVDRAFERTILFMQEWADDKDTEWYTYFDTVPTNLATFHICSGKISPWILYASEQAQHLLERMNQEQINLIIDYIDPNVWNIKTKRQHKDFTWVKQVLKEANLS